MICDLCHQHAPTKYVEFRQNIGLLVMRIYKTFEGDMCASCIRSTFWRCTLITVTLGWWGLISFFVAPYCLATNILQYLDARDVEPAGAQKRAPAEAHPTLSLTPEAHERLSA